MKSMQMIDFNIFAIVIIDILKNMCGVHEKFGFNRPSIRSIITKQHGKYKRAQFSLHCLLPMNYQMLNASNYIL